MLFSTPKVISLVLATQIKIPKTFLTKGHQPTLLQRKPSKMFIKSLSNLPKSHCKRSETQCKPSYFQKNLSKDLLLGSQTLTESRLLKRLMSKTVSRRPIMSKLARKGRASIQTPHQIVKFHKNCSFRRQRARKTGSLKQPNSQEHAKTQKKQNFAVFASFF